jgi:hypothetical protein
MDIDELIHKNKLLEDEVALLREKLKNYTAPKRSKKFYDVHKDEILQKNKEYKQKTNYYSNLSQEKKREYARTAYLNKKAKLDKINNEDV